jgi:hypothetical protein
MKIIRVKKCDGIDMQKGTGFYAKANSILKDEQLAAGAFKRIFDIVKKEGEWDDSKVNKFLNSSAGEALASAIVTENRVDYTSNKIKLLIRRYSNGV